jgi:hypothetical protein
VDGTLYCSAGQYDGKLDGTQGDFIYKSTDGGRTWTKTTTQPSEVVGTHGMGNNGMPITSFLNTNLTTPSAPATQMNIITDIQCPGADGNTVYCTDGYDIFKSTNGGVTWAADVNLFNAGVGANGYIVSISIGYIGTNAYVFAGTSTFGGGGGGGVFVLQESVYNNPWADLNVGTNRPIGTSAPNLAFGGECDVTKVQVDPSFATTQMVMAVVSDYENEVTRVTTKYGSLEWDTTASDVLLKNTVSGAPNPGSTDPFLLTSSIYLPSDFTSNVASGNMVAFVGTDVMPGQFTETGANGFGDVYLCYFGAAPPTTPSPTTAFDLNVAGPNTAFNVSGMSGVGPAASADIMVCGYTNTTGGLPNPTPSVYTTLNGGVTWTVAAKEPTGSVSQLTQGILSEPAPLCSVMLTGVGNAFTTSGAAIVGTHGIDCGLSGTTDFGNTFNTLSPNTTVSGGVNFTSTNVTTVGKISLATDGTIYETSASAGSNCTVEITTVAAGVITAYSYTPGVQYNVGDVVTFHQTGSGNNAHFTVTGTDGYGHITAIGSFSGGTGYTTTSASTTPYSVTTTDVTATPYAFTSAWRYSPTNSAWDRIDSWSLYNVYAPLSPTAYDTVNFNLISTTPAQDAVFIANSSGSPPANQLYRSTNKGQIWMQWGQQVPTTNGAISSWLVINSSTVLVGVTGNGTTTGGVIFTTTNGAVWQLRQAFSNATVEVSNIVLAPNGNYLAAGCDSLGDINIAQSSTSGVTWTSSDTGTATRQTGAVNAYIGAAADYATSGIVYYCGDFPGIYFSTVGGTVNRADNVATWDKSSIASTGLITAPGGPGLTPEGTGMEYATTAAGVLRVKGRVATTAPTATAELIPNPTGQTLTGLYVSTSSVGNVTLYAIGSNNSIYSYTDTLNGTVAGVAVPAATLTTNPTSTSTTPSSAVINWTAVPNATNYFIIVDNTAQWTNLYDAENGVANSTVAAWAITATNSVTFTQRFVPNTSYYVTVWALRDNTTTPFVLANFGAGGTTAGGTTPTYLQQTFALSTFGGAITFTPPLQVPTTPINLVPALGSTISPVNPNFDWMSVTGATSYTLQITTASDPGFASPVYANSAVPAVSGPTANFTYVGTLAYNASYIWRVMANGTTGSTWVNGNFYTALAVVPPVTVTQAATPPTPTIIITAPAPITITQAAPPVTPTLTVTQPVYTLVQPTATTPTYIWVIVAVGAVLTLAVIVLIIRTRRVV